MMSKTWHAVGVAVVLGLATTAARAADVAWRDGAAVLGVLPASDDVESRRTLLEAGDVSLRLEMGALSLSVGGVEQGRAYVGTRRSYVLGLLVEGDTLHAHLNGVPFAIAGVGSARGGPLQQWDGCAEVATVDSGAAAAHEALLARTMWVVPDGADVLAPAEAWKGVFAGRGFLTPLKPADADGHPHALRFDLTKAPWTDGGADYAARMQQSISEAVEQGDTLLVSLWARGVHTDAADGLAHLMLYVKHPRHGHARSLELPVAVPVSSRWTRILVPFRARKASEAGQWEAWLFVPGQSGVQQAQVIDVADVQLLRFPGKTTFDLPHAYGTYGGREPDAPWRKQAAERIAHHRAGDLTVQVVDQQGQPLSGVSVEATLTRHAFGFGSLLDEGRIAQTDPNDPGSYAATAHRLFDTATVPIWWWLWDRNPKDWRGRVTRAVDRLQQWDLRRHGHVLVWETFDQGQLAEAAREAWLSGNLRGPGGLQDLIRDHIHAMAQVPSFQGLTSLEVHNHPLFYRALRRADGTGLTDDDTLQWYQWARAAFGSDVDLFCNEAAVLEPGYTNRQGYFDYVTRLLGRGADFDGVAFQCHFSRPDAVGNILATLDRFADAGHQHHKTLRLMVSEYDMANILDEHLQADFLRDVLTACYAHPQVDRFIMWGFQDDGPLDPDKPIPRLLLRADGSRRAGYYAWRDLVQRQWRPIGTAAATDARGRATLRTTWGDHTLTLRRGGQTFTTAVTAAPEQPAVQVGWKPQ